MTAIGGRSGQSGGSASQAAAPPVCRAHWAFTGTKRFRPVAILGRGSTGVVYRVHDEELATDVALKTLEMAGADQLYRLKQEFRALADITHPNLVELFELVVSDADRFFTMEFVEGVDLTAHLRDVLAQHDGDGSRLSPTDRELAPLLDAARQLVLGVSAVHAAGKLHRDVKPSNIRVTPEGRVVLLDFGLVTALGLGNARDTTSGALAGTLAYMAPEQGWGSPPAAPADWYSVGVVLYEAITGRLPFDGPPARLLLEKAEAPPPAPRRLVPGLPDHLDALVTTLLDPDPARRPGAEEILARLLGCGEPQPVVRERPTAACKELPFVGRTEELATLRSAFESVAQGHAAAVHVYGPSGIGKTELVRRFLSWAETQGDCAVLRGRCHPHEDVPYKALDALIDALSRRLVCLPESSAAAMVPRHAAALTRVFPVLARVPALAAWTSPEDRAEPYEVRRRAVGALRELLGKLADRQPLALWIDDLQWGDPDSVTVLRGLIRAPDAPAMLLLLSYRSADRDSMLVLRALQGDAEELPRGSTREVRLGRLSAEETRELVTVLAGSRLGSTDDIAAIAAECEGSPFLASQLVHVLSATGQAGARGTPASQRLAEVLNKRVAQLPSAARHVLEVVSVAGHPLERRVVLDAAGVAERGRTVVTHLEQQRLLRSTPGDGATAVEVYHDWIREVIAGSLSAESLCERHREIAESLERLPEPDPQQLFTHYLGAGLPEAASRYAVPAADQAAAALAFDRAADLYRQALRLRRDLPEDWALQVKVAEALANAGRGGEAAESFEAAAAALASCSPGHEEAAVLKRRAAEQYLRSGHVERGTALMRAVLAELGIPLPPNSLRAVASAVLQRVRFLWRGARSTLRRPEDVPPRTCQRLSACWAGSTGLVVVDPILADGLGLRCLLEALEAGDRPHAIRGLGLEAIREAALGGRLFGRRSARLLRQAEQIARESGDPYDEAWLRYCVGACAYFGARWRRAREECDASVAMMRERCHGVAWEIVTGDSFAITALGHMGELRELSRRLPAAVRDGDQRGDLYAATSLRMGVPALLWLAQDRPHDALALADEAIAPWPATTFLVQHYLHLIATVQADLYLGDARAAWRRVLEARPRLRRSFIPSSVAVARVELRNLRARAALAATVAWGDLPARTGPPDPAWPSRRLVRLAEAEARRLARERLPSALPYARMIRAGLAALAGRDAEALGLLDRAARGFAAADMALHQAAAEYRQGSLCGGEEGRRLRQRSEGWMRTQDIRDPAAMLAALAPGFRG